MPVNRNALIRYRTIDNCLKNRQRRWTLEDLMDACSEALYEYEGIDKGVGRRSVQMDIQLMRSDKLGYNAPIVVLEKKYYTYDDPDYSITNIPLTDQDLSKLTEVVEILRQFKGFSHFRELSGMVQRLENKIYVAKTNQEPIIDFEKNEDLKGLQHIDTLYQAIIKKCAVELCYQSFKARSPNTFHFKFRSPERKLKMIATSRSQDGRAILEITDNGLGFNIDLHHEKVFKLYRRFHAHIGGRGIGLYLIKTQVEVLHGSVEGTSQPDKDSMFRIILLLSAEENLI